MKQRKEKSPYEVRRKYACGGLLQRKRILNKIGENEFTDKFENNRIKFII